MNAERLTWKSIRTASIYTSGPYSFYFVKCGMSCKVSAPYDCRGPSVRGCIFRLISRLKMYLCWAFDKGVSGSGKWARLLLRVKLSVALDLFYNDFYGLHSVCKLVLFIQLDAKIYKTKMFSTGSQMKVYSHMKGYNGAWEKSVDFSSAFQETWWQHQIAFNAKHQEFWIYMYERFRVKQHRRDGHTAAECPKCFVIGIAIVVGMLHTEEI